MDAKNINSIIDTIKHKESDFDFISAFGQLIQNDEFKQGFVQAQLGKNNQNTYLYEALSAVGHDIGSVLYDNVLNYIDNISNVDTCKVTALRSMLKMFGFDYSLFDDIQVLPLEIRNLVDLLSINRNYLIENEYIKEDMRKTLTTPNIFPSNINVEEYNEPAILNDGEYSQDENLSSDIRVYSRTFIQDNFDNYLQNVYYNLLNDFLNLEYNVPVDEISTHSILSSNCIKDTLTDNDNYFVHKNIILDYTNTDNDEIIRLKRIHNIIKFDEKEIVDKIDNGEDSLDNYDGIKREIIEREISRRASTLKIIDNSNNELYTNNNLSTRYSYYRKAKVLEYAKFIDNKFYSENIGSKDYDIDKNYSIITKEGFKNVISYQTDSNGNRPIDNEMVVFVANSLVNVTKYISTLREQLKLQTRKNYMKGTSNLLKLIVFQFLYDYAMTYNTNAVTNEVKELLENMYKNIEIDDIKIQEYFDITEYFNLSSATTPYALNNQYVNNRFFDEYFERINGKISLKKRPQHFTENQLTSFYNNILNMHDINQINPLDGLYEFLSAIYEVGANSTYVRPSDMKVMSQLENGIYTKDLIDQFNTLTTSYERFKWYLYNDNAVSSYHFPSDTIRKQKIDAKQFISSWISEYEMSSISSTYDEYISVYNSINDDIKKLSTDYQNFISSEYVAYFQKSDYVYCYETSGKTKTYKHDYFIGNQYWDQNNYIQNAIQNLITYSSISSNIQNHIAYDTIDTLLNGYGDMIHGYYNLKEQTQSIVSRLEPYGYAKLGTEDLIKELDNTENYVKQKISSKLTFLQNSLQDLKSQTTELQNQYQQIETQFANCIAQCPGIDQGYYFTFSGVEKDENGSSVRTGSYITCDYKSTDAIYDKNSGQYFKESIKESGSEIILNGYYNLVNVKVDMTSGSLKQRMDNLNKALGGNVYYGTNYTGAANVKESIKSLLVTHSNLGTVIDSIIKQVNDLFGVIIPKSSNDVDLTVISNIFDALNTITDENFQGNEQIKIYNSIQSDIINLKYDLNVTQNAYETFKKDSSQIQYFSNFSFMDNVTPTSMSLISAYVEKIDQMNYKSINDQCAQLNKRLQDIIVDYQQKTSNLMIYYPGNVLEQYQYDSSIHIEDNLVNLNNFLLIDIANRYQDAYYNVQLSCDDIDNIYIDFNYALSDYHISPDTNGKLSDDVNVNMLNLVEDKITSIDFYNNQSYKDDTQLMHAYGGLSDSYDPYYNHKNKTHPSFQIHPFMYNFVEKPSTRVQNITRQFTNLFYSDFNRKYIDKVIGKYIGNCGQSIGIWKNNTLDYTGYVTTYEMSKHIDQDTGEYSEVIGYDGMFYPPALRDLVNDKMKFLNSLSDHITLTSVSNFAIKDFNSVDLVSDPYSYMSNRIGNIFNTYYPSPSPLGTIVNEFKQKFNNTKPEEITQDIFQNFIEEALSVKTYFEKYYYHLRLPDGDYSHIANQLNVYYDKLSDFNSQKSNLSSLVDIYRYSVDSNGNIYTLCKKYDVSNPSYIYKKNQMGELWMRKKNHPISLPALTPVNNRGTLDYSYTNVAYSIEGYDEQHVSKYMFDKTNLAALNGNCFYDFVMSNDGKYILFVHNYNGYLDNDIKHSIVSFTFSKKLYDNVKQRNYVIFNKLIDERNEHSDCIPISQDLSSNYEYICTVPTGSYASRIMYIVHEDGYDNLLMYSTNDIHKQFNSFQGRISNNRLDSDLIACSFYKKYNNTYFDMFVVDGNVIEDDDEQHFMETYIDSKVDINHNTDDTLYVKDDNDITSHDIFSNKLNIISFRLNGNEFSEIQRDPYNINADMSYIPNYPGLCGELNLSNDLKDFNIVDVELLGMANDIDAKNEYTDISSNQYFDMDKYKLYQKSDFILNGIYGRIYEDFPESYTDKTIRFETNPLMDYKLKDKPEQVIQPQPGNNTFVQYSSDTLGRPCYRWIIPLDTSSSGDECKKYSYSIQEYRNLQVTLYKKNTRNRNFYYNGNFIDIDQQPVKYDSDLSSMNISESIVMNKNNDTLVIAGSTDSILKPDEISYSLNNHIDNISDITLQIGSNAGIDCIFVNFIIEDNSKPVSISKEDIQLVLFNKFDLDQFYLYHYLDQYGVLRLDRYMSVGLRNIFSEEGWALIYDQERLSKKDIMADVEEYYDEWSKDVGGSLASRIVNIKSVDLNRYNYLSDVYILNKDKFTIQYGDQDSVMRVLSTLSFKEDEEITNDEMLKYIKRKDLDSNFPYTAGQLYASDINSVQSNISNVFSQDDTFILYAEDNSILDNIGNVVIPTKIDTTNDIRVYEDYYLDGNNKKYSTTSPEFYHFAHIMVSSDTDFNTMKSYDLSNQSNISQVEEKLFETKTICLKSEKDDTNNETIYRIKDFSKEFQNVDIAKLLKVVINYKREYDDTITLFFNYNNYFAPSYETIDNDNRPTMNVLEGSYLKLKQGQTGFLDMNIQFKYYIDGLLYGYRTGKVMTYEITNVSDDKPKFIIRPVYKMVYQDRDSTFSDENNKNNAIRFVINNIDIFSSGRSIDPSERYKSVTFEVKMIIPEDIDLEYVNANIIFPTQLLKDKSGTKYVNTPGYKSHTFTKQDRTWTFDMYIDQTTISKYVNKQYMISLEDIDVKSGEHVDVETNIAFIRVMREKFFILALNDNDGEKVAILDPSTDKYALKIEET